MDTRKVKINNIQHMFALESIAMYMCNLDEMGSVEYQNKGFFRLLGYEEELHTTSIIEYVHKQDRELYLNFVESRSFEAGTSNCVYRLIKKDGTLVQVLDTMESKILEDGIMHGVSVLVDIGMHMDVQKQYKESLEREMVFNHSFERLLKFSKVLFFELDRSNHEYTLERNIEDVLLYKPSELRAMIDERKDVDDEYGQILGDIYFLLHPDEKERAIQAFEQLERNGEFYGEYRFLCGDGLYHWFEVQMFWLDDSKTTNIGYIKNVDERRERMDHLRHTATTDQLTGLLNKTGGFEQVREYLANHEDQLSAFIFIDMDNFKSVNDRYGHDYGDEIISCAASMIRSVFRESDILARFGGDEFMILMKDIKTKETAFNRINEIYPLCKQRQRELDREVCISLSIGVSFTDKHKTIEALFKEADRHLYEAKVRGKGKCVSNL